MYFYVVCIIQRATTQVLINMKRLQMNIVVVFPIISIEYPVYFRSYLGGAVSNAPEPKLC